MVTQQNPWDHPTRIKQLDELYKYVLQKQELIDGSLEEIQNKCEWVADIINNCVKYPVLERWDLETILQQIENMLKKF